MRILDFAKALAQPDISNNVKYTITQIRESGYMSLGQFIRDLPDLDLSWYQQLSGQVILGSENPTPASDLISTNMIILAEALALGEADAPLTDDDAVTNTQFLITLFSIESLKRKGLVNVFYDKISFASIHGDEPIVELTALGRQASKE